MTDDVTAAELLGVPSRWWCIECGYALLDESNWRTHQEWHRRERVRAEYAEADAEIEREMAAQPEPATGGREP